jgi:REP element-mobilizing transposase RayT
MLKHSCGFAALFAEKLRFSVCCAKISERLCRRLPTMFLVSRDTPAYYLTSVAHDRLPIFQKDSIKQVVCDAFDEARKSGGIMIFAYVIMPDHTHLLTDSPRKIGDVLRFTNGISAKRLIDHLRSNGYESSLQKLQIEERENKHKHSVYEHHPNALRVTGEDALIQKANYIHFNPVRGGLVEHPDDYLYSSARLWNKRPLENEPLVTDHARISWR